MNKLKEEVQQLRKLLLEEQSKTANYQSLVQEKEFLENQYELIKAEFLREISKDTEIRLDAKVRDLQRQVQGTLLVHNYFHRSSIDIG